MISATFFLSILGSLSGFQILTQLHSLRVISRQTLAHSKRILPPAIVLLMYVMREHPFLCLLMLVVFHLIPPLFMVFNQALRRRHFQREILFFLDELLLKMRSGVSFRESLANLEGFRNSRGSIDLAEISSLISYPERGEGLVLIAEAQELLFEMRKMDQSSARIIEKVRAFRHKEKMLMRFRQKSSQVTSQARAQAMVCSFLYVALLFWIAVSDREALFSGLTLLSAVLFMSGVLMMMLIERGFRWKL